jgi:hypothetical protein
MRHAIFELVGQSISEVIEDQSVKLHKGKSFISHGFEKVWEVDRMFVAKRD